MLGVGHEGVIVEPHIPPVLVPIPPRAIVIGRPHVFGCSLRVEIDVKPVSSWRLEQWKPGSVRRIVRIGCVIHEMIPRTLPTPLVWWRYIERGDVQPVDGVLFLEEWLWWWKSFIEEEIVPPIGDVVIVEDIAGVWIKPVLNGGRLGRCARDFPFPEPDLFARPAVRSIGIRRDVAVDAELEPGHRSVKIVGLRDAVYIFPGAPEMYVQDLTCG